MFHKNFGGKKFFIKTFFREDFRGKKWDPSTINKLTKNITQLRNKKFTIIFFSFNMITSWSINVRSRDLNLYNSIDPY